MTTLISQHEQSLIRRIARVNEQISGLENKLHALDNELASHANQRQQYQLLGDICSSLDKLNEMGASDLFWGRSATGYDPEQQLQRVRSVVAEFEQKISVIEQSRTALQDIIKIESVAAFLLNDELAELQDEAEITKNDYVLERQANEIPFRPMVLPWSRQGEDEQRFRKILLIVLLFSILFGWVIPLLKQPADRSKEAVIPERIAQLVKKRQEPKPVEQKPQEKLAEKLKEKLQRKKTRRFHPKMRSQCL